MSTSESKSVIEARLDRLESSEAIRRLMADYCHGIDKRDLKRFEAIWHPDATFVLGPIGEMHGIEAIRSAIVDLVWATALPESHHHTVNVSLTFTGEDEADALADVHAIAVDGNGQRLRILATYRDVFQRRDGDWRFLRREGQIHSQAPLG